MAVVFPKTLSLSNSLKVLNFDYVIAGAGASGLLLAREMISRGLLKEQTLCLIDREFKTINDRTWCFWSKEKLPFILEENVSYSWGSCISEDVINTLTPYRYCHIRSDDFYKSSWQVLKMHPQVEIITDNISKIDQKSEGLEICLSSSLIRCKRLFNSIPELYNKEKPIINLWQSFYGWRIRFSGEEIIPLDFKLMDFDVEQSDSTQFMYVLPFDENSALVELTRFGREMISPEGARQILEEYLGRLNVSYRIEDLEYNKIPMSQAFDSSRKVYPHKQAVLQIGTAAGALKPSSGYGFLKMHEHAERIVDALLEGKPLPCIYRKKRFRLYDKLLLQILEKEPSKGRTIFKLLLGKIPTSLVLKFLDEETNILEEIKIFSVLPKMLFFKYLVLHWLKK